MTAIDRKTVLDRAAGALMGAFIGDALALGPHWYYDLDELRERNAMTCRETVEKSIRTLTAQHATLSDQLRQADIYDVATVSGRLRQTEHEIRKLNKRLEQIRTSGRPVSGSNRKTEL